MEFGLADMDGLVFSTCDAIVTKRASFLTKKILLHATLKASRKKKLRMRRRSWKKQKRGRKKYASSVETAWKTQLCVIFCVVPGRGPGEALLLGKPVRPPSPTSSQPGRDSHLRPQMYGCSSQGKYHHKTFCKS